jgi:hypothetical protein
MATLDTLAVRPNVASSSMAYPSAAQQQLDVSTKSKGLWRQAYASLKEKESALVEDYERRLSPSDSTFDDQEEMQKAIKDAIEVRDARQLVLKLFGRSVKIREYGEKLVKFITWSQNYILPVVSTEPHAALPCAAVSALLPVRLFPKSQHLRNASRKLITP